MRLLVPDYEGNMSIKWLRRLEVTDIPVHSREETSKYTDLLPDGKAREFTYMMEAKSIITSPSGTQRVAGKGFCELKGIALARCEIACLQGFPIVRPGRSIGNVRTEFDQKTTEPATVVRCMKRSWSGP